MPISFVRICLQRDLPHRAARDESETFIGITMLAQHHHRGSMMAPSIIPAHYKHS